MSGSTNWQDANAEYLSTALAWLRGRLEAHTGQVAEIAPLPVTASATASATQAASPVSFWQRAFKAAVQQAPAQLTSAPVSMRTTKAGALTAKNSSELATSNANGAPLPALPLLAKQLGLSTFEQDVLLLCVAMELDTGLAALCARANGDASRIYPTFALAMTLFDAPAWEVLSPQRPLRYWRLIEINQPGAQPLITSALRADERIVNYLKGLNYLDDRLAPLVTPLASPSSQVDPPASQAAVVETIVDQLKSHGGTRIPLVQLLGTDTASKELVAQSAAKAFALQPYRMPARHLTVSAGELERIARLWQRESLLLPLALYLDTQEIGSDDTHSEPGVAVNRFLSRIDCVIFLDSRDPWSGVAPTSISVDIGKPSSEEQQAIWAAALGDAAGESPALLAGQFDLNFARQQQLARQALAQTADAQAPLQTRLWDACLASTRPQMGAMAQRLDPKACWDDLILPASENGLLRQIAAQVGQRGTVYNQWGFRSKMNRGLGISTLFAGESGTGKTMAAEVIANDLRLNLYRIDLSAVVSKYIGETEKNLRRLFDAAEDGGAILFFDEADALFGKRSEVKDSHDRYANIETNYLLQRMEAYRGLAILATNMKSALDPAFLRRLRFVVNFPFPGAAERKVMWQQAFPPQAPTDGLDFDRLAKLNLTGGHIHNIAINAAFLAARAKGRITMPVVLDAARTEFRKLERPINEADFRWSAVSGLVA
ncbi:ATP-binding protein [Collimonas sp. H4R21]|uniref:ATP-binding protein n=1 Tax=Collimonas rhizosphaerae TaxID=3126357 RepID=A0ABU9PVM2_9BURK